MAREYPLDRSPLMLSAYIDNGTVVAEAVNKGRIHAFIPKPVEPELLLEEVREAAAIFRWTHRL